MDKSNKRHIIGVKNILQSDLVIRLNNYIALGKQVLNKTKSLDNSRRIRNYIKITILSAYDLRDKIQNDEIFNRAFTDSLKRVTDPTINMSVLRTMR